MRNHSNENEFDLRENGRAGETHFHMNGFAQRLVLTQRQNVTQKWLIKLTAEQSCFEYKLLFYQAGRQHGGGNVLALFGIQHKKLQV